MRTLVQRSASFATLVLASTVLISGCSGQSGQPQGPTVASIASVPRTDSSSGPATTNAAAERPLIRLDTTQEEMERMFEAYEKCLSDHGVPSKAEQVKSKKIREYPAATAACAAKQPEDYQEREKRAPLPSRRAAVVSAEPRQA